MLDGLLLALKNNNKIICPVDMLNAQQLCSMGTDSVCLKTERNFRSCMVLS